MQVWIIPADLIAPANAVLDAMGMGPNNIPRLAENPDTGDRYGWTVHDPSPEFQATWDAAASGDMGADVQQIVQATTVYRSPDPDVPEDEQTALDARALLARAMADMGLEVLPE